MSHKINNKNKRAVSVLVSYVLLLTMAITLAMLIGSWLYKMAKNPPLPEEVCEGMSLEISSVACDSQGTSLNLVLKNRGRFYIDGAIIKVDSSGDISDPYRCNKYEYFDPPLPPSFSGNQETTLEYSFSDFTTSSCSLTPSQPITRVKVTPLKGETCASATYLGEECIICSDIEIEQKVTCT